MATPYISYLNEPEINRFYKIYNIKDHLEHTSKFTVEASLFNLFKVSHQVEKKKDEFDIIDKLLSIWNYLDNNKLISTSRPNSIGEAYNNETDFVFETVSAHKLFFPINSLIGINRLEHLVVWVVEPEFEKLSGEPWFISGTFLFLIESLYDKENFATTRTGCTALQALSNIVKGEPFFTIGTDERFGIPNPKHPIEKLKDLGAVYLHKQEISTIYRKKYMTNEQTFIYDERKYRCNDLLAYPLFIS